MGRRNDRTRVYKTCRGGTGREATATAGGGRRRVTGVAGLTAMVGLGLVVAACIEVPKPPSQDAIAVRDVHVSTGLQLAMACVPTGVERCFDAVDDNCNGVIDEGCGLHTGLLQFAIAWSQAEVDVDLVVTGPDGMRAATERTTRSGLVKDRDCPGRHNRCRGQNIENVFLAEGKPRTGRYRVSVQLSELNGGHGEWPIQVRLSARVGQRYFTSLVELTKDTQQREFEFSL